MRYLAFLLGLVFLLSISAGAQTTASNSVLLPVLLFCCARQRLIAPANAPAISLTPFSSAPANTPPGALALFHAALVIADACAAAPPQDVTSVFETYAWQLYGGYTFLRFYELPGITPNMNGFNFSVVYYWKDWLGARWRIRRDSRNSRATLAPGSCSAAAVRVFVGPRKKESNSGRMPWSAIRTSRRRRPPAIQHAFAYELGGGVDLPFKPRWALRLGADAMCTTLLQHPPIQPDSPRGRSLPLLALRHRAMVGRGAACESRCSAIHPEIPPRLIEGLRSRFRHDLASPALLGLALCDSAVR